jgi:hypothetical protein
MGADSLWCRVTVMTAGGTVLSSWPVAGRGTPTLEAVDRLARLRLRVAKTGGSVVVREVSPDLDALLELVGLRDLLRGG